jgi:hypothetical protein
MAARTTGRRSTVKSGNRSTSERGGKSKSGSSRGKPQSGAKGNPRRPAVAKRKLRPRASPRRSTAAKRPEARLNPHRSAAARRSPALRADSRRPAAARRKPRPAAANRVHCRSGKLRPAGAGPIAAIRARPHGITSSSAAGPRSAAVNRAWSRARRSCALISTSQVGTMTTG